jgi:FkbM family methyltransferase
MQKLRKLLYRLGWLKAYWEVDRFRYLKRLGKPDSDDWRYASKDDAAQFEGREVVASMAGEGAPILFFCDPRSVIEAEILKTGAFQARILELGRSVVRAPGLVIDVGSNVGAYAVPWAGRCPEVIVHCFEPLPACLVRLRRNIELNGLGAKVRLHALALSDTTGEAILHAIRADDGNQGLSTLRPDILGSAVSTPLPVPVRRLDDVLAGETAPVRLIKVDVQGQELEVLRGARAVIERDRPPIILEHEDVLFASAQAASERKAELGEFLARLGYKALYVSRWGSGLMSPVNWSRPLNGDILALPFRTSGEMDGP